MMLVDGVIKKQPAILLVPFVMAAIGFIVLKRLTFDLADEVKDAGEFLLVRKGSVEQRIAMDEIINVSMSYMVNPPRLSLRLRKPGKLGDEVTFIPQNKFSFNPFARNLIAEDLIARVDRARTSK